MKIEMREVFEAHWKRRHNPAFREYLRIAIQYEKMLRTK